MSHPKVDKYKEINIHLARAWNAFLELPGTHPDHNRYFRDGIHKCQMVLMWKEMQKRKPDLYPKHCPHVNRKDESDPLGFED